MRVKQLWINFSFLGQLRLVWDRITVSRLTIGYFIFSVLHCIIQTGFQTRVFVLNHSSASWFSTILEETNTRRTDAYPLIQNDMRLCPSDETRDDCFVIWDGSPQINFVGPANSSVTLPEIGSAATQEVTSVAPSSSAITTTSATTNASPTNGAPANGAPANGSPTSGSPTNGSPPPAKTANAAADLDDLFESDGEESEDEGGISSASGSASSDSEAETQPPAPSPAQPRAVTSKTLARRVEGYYTVMLPQGEAQLTDACVRSLNYPVFALERTEREDAALIIFNLWVLGMSVVALLNESIPHILASLLTHVMSTAWAAFQLLHTQHFHADFTAAVANGACAGVPSFLTAYWGTRMKNELPALVLNCLALCISAGLTTYLLKTFGWKTYKRIGASMLINRLYKVVLVFSVLLQLSLFFIAITVGVWVDQLFNGPAKYLANHRTIYEAVSIVTILAIVPWVYTGWTGARQEIRMRMNIFFGLSVLYVAVWLLQLMSHTFRWMVTSWPFFGLMVAVSLVLTVVCLILAILVRVNFGKGLLNYLNKSDDLPDAQFEPFYLNKGDEEDRGSFHEKIEFPSNHASLTQYPISVLNVPVTLPPPVQTKAASTKRTLPDALRNVSRYQGLFKHKSSSSKSASTTSGEGPKPLILGADVRTQSFYNYDQSDWQSGKPGSDVSSRRS